MIVSALPLRLQFLGPPEALLGETPLAFPTRKTLALLIYLAIEAGLQPREHLAALLWPEGSPERSYASLRNTLSHLQMALSRAAGGAKTTCLLITHNALGLNTEASIDLDLRRIDRAYAQARADRSSRSQPQGSASQQLLQSASDCYRGDFLAGFSLSDAPNFDQWQTIQREIWHRRLALVLDRLSEIQYAGGEFACATDTASRWIALDQLHEAAYRRKMRAHFAAGERSQALETYQSCRAVLEAELGLEPDPETEALAARIRSQQPPQRVPSLPRRLLTPVAFLETQFAGRNMEHRLLVERYQHACASQPQLVIFRGEAGIGKTRLAREFLGWAGAQGAQVLQGGAFESGSHLPFQPLTEALRSWLEGADSPEELAQAWSPSLSQLLPEWAGSNSSLPARLQERSSRAGAISQAQLFESFVQLTLSLAKRKPLLFFMDDLQWADSATLDLLQYLIRRWQECLPPALLLISLRSEALHPMSQPHQSDGPSGLYRWLAQAEREIDPTHLDLQPIDESATVEMINSILAEPAADFAQWVYAETHGQPFYLMETLKDLLERGAIHPKRRTQGQWAFIVDAEHNLGQAVRVPSTVRAVIRSRLDRLSPNAFTLLVVAAALEQQISFEHLCAISSLSEDAALPALDELISGRLLLEVAQPGAASAYPFANDMIRDVVYTEAGDAAPPPFPPARTGSPRAGQRISGSAGSPCPGSRFEPGRLPLQPGSRSGGLASLGSQ